MPKDSLIIKAEGEIATVTLNRPDQRNALNRGLRDAFEDFLDNHVDRFKVVIITGAGASFCAGMDLKEPVGHNEGATQWRFFRKLFNTDAIVIGALNGPVVGAGLSMVTACDLAIADPTVKFLMPQITHGIYGSVATPMLHLTLPKKVVAEMALTGLPMSAERAREVGLINSIAEPKTYLDQAHQLAQRIAGFDKTALKVTKHVIKNVPVDDAQRATAIKEVNFGVLSNLPKRDDRVIDTQYGGNRK